MVGFVVYFTLGVWLCELVGMREEILGEKRGFICKGFDAHNQLHIRYLFKLGNHSDKIEVWREENPTHKSPSQKQICNKILIILMMIN